MILGYKEFRKGKDLYKKEQENIDNNKKWMYNNIADFIGNFRVLSFDELALKQLDVKRIMSKEKWDLYYQGGDGQSTMFIDMIEEVFAKSSISNKRYNLNSVRCLDDALRIIQDERNS